MDFQKRGHYTSNPNTELDIPQITLQLHCLILQNLDNLEVMIPDFSDSRKISWAQKSAEKKIVVPKTTGRYTP